MIDSVVRMAVTTGTLILICILGVSGNIDSVEMYRDAIAVETNRGEGIRPSVAVGGFIVGYPRGYAHEYGHILQERQLGSVYYFVVAIPSLILAGQRNDTVWPETWADELGAQ